MTGEQRDEFVQRRVKDILRVYTEQVANISAMTEQQRDDFVHRRVEHDIAMSESIAREFVDVIESREMSTKIMLATDAVALIAVAGFVAHDWQGILSVVIVAASMSATYIINSWIVKKAYVVLDLMYRQASHQANTATLDFLVDDIHTDNP